MTTITGRQAVIIICDEFMDVSADVQAAIIALSRQGTGIIFSDDFIQFEPSALAMRCSMIEASPVEFNPRDYDPLPKPTKQKLLIKKPKRQSFRQSIRSVNRNR